MELVRLFCLEHSPSSPGTHVLLAGNAGVPPAQAEALRKPYALSSHATPPEEPAFAGGTPALPV